jgi:hypothetical protein
MPLGPHGLFSKAVIHYHSLAHLYSNLSEAMILLYLYETKSRLLIIKETFIKDEIDTKFVYI